jgi:N-methylhydantoinase B
VLSTKPAGVLVRAGETIAVESPGAGGYRPARERSRAAIELDRRNGKFSDSYIERYYQTLRAAEQSAETD